MNELDSLRAQLEKSQFESQWETFSSYSQGKQCFQTQKEILFGAVPQHQAQNIWLCSLQKMKDLNYSPEYYSDKDKIHNEYNLSHCLLQHDQPLRITSAGEDKSQRN